MGGDPCRGMFRAPGREVLLAQPPAGGTVPLTLLPPGKDGTPPPFSFRCAEKKSAVDGGKEKGAFPDEQGESWPLNQVFSGFRRNESAPYSWPRAFRSAKRYLGGWRKSAPAAPGDTTAKRRGFRGPQRVTEAPGQRQRLPTQRQFLTLAPPLTAQLSGWRSLVIMGVLRG